MLKNRFIPLFLMACTPILAACSTLINGSLQEVKFTSVGADDVYCEAQTGENSYSFTVRPPAKVGVQRSKKPIYMTCAAPGNRTLQMKVSSNIAENSYLNAATAGATLAVDATTGAMYEYPKEVVIDFRNVYAKDQPLPAYQNQGTLDPKDQAIEYLGPDTPVLEGDKDLEDRYKAAYDKAAREEAEAAANATERERRLEAVEGGFYGDKGATPDTPVPAKPKSAIKPSNQEVQIAPLSEAAPAPKTALPTNDVVVPQVNPQLSKPIFPQSTTFNQ